jgi:tetratricopeptide (TPR) repeat protein
MRALTWIAPTLLAAAGVALAGEPGAAEQTRKRLHALDDERDRIEKLLAGLDLGAVASTVAPEAAPLGPQAPGAAFLPLPNADQIEFERARVESLRLKVARAREARASRPAPASAPASPPAAPSSRATHARLEAASAIAAVASAAPAAVDPLRVAETLAATGDHEGAARAFSDAAAAAERCGDRHAYARARYGEARSLERIGRSDDALALYKAVASLTDGGEWGRAAQFAWRFVEWRRRLDASAHPRAATKPEGRP